MATKGPIQDPIVDPMIDPRTGEYAVIAPGHNFKSVTQKIAGIVLTSNTPLGWFFGLVFGLISFVLLLGAALVWIFLMLRAYTGKKFKLPFFGDYAEKMVNRFTK